MKIKVMRTVIRMIDAGIPSDRIFTSVHVNMMVASGDYLVDSHLARSAPKKNRTHFTNYTTDK
ncbi:hypothetical protein DUG15_07895 [Salmonella enterica]|uniref:Uncharacterized protein n=2 Tax=Salmonella enterica TaxID=28901 RepID=A0A403T1X0_SALER|nr:hypothetical protein [Salmonella enterica subsp. enterica serovar Hadar]EBJ4268875.1 hypothetical protein [Salmonella enterica]EBQ9004606.1 hypothetical protein [Salmonella enterica subsp. enterica serovar Blockley]EBR8259052.1 hypothetical protein [Salmonella enterica subsp. enterica serovar Cerro]EBW7251896.1 hypothetical protein [Salmonella enterica subsp. enterica serovar Gatow]EBX7468994.1 hypothetical protein [Salmonella enterica subsp. enterica serovar Bareilly]ECA3791353.1 hypothet